MEQLSRSGWIGFNFSTMQLSRTYLTNRVMPRFPYARIASLVFGACLAAAPVSAQVRRTILIDLPITEVPATTGNTLAVFWSGDGGWATLVSSISKELAANGVAVVGINARSWMSGGKRTPDDVARDTERLLRAYLAQWSRTRIVLLGYSRGAGFMPFIINRLPADLRDRVALVGLLGAERSASFEFHLTDLVRTNKRVTDVAVLPEIQRSTGTRYFCLYGKSEDDTICPELDTARTTIVSRTGDHHFDRNYPAIAQDILKALPTK